MENIYFLLLAFLFVWYFLYLRKIAEAGQHHVAQYCKEADVQFISIFRRSSRLTFTKELGLHWLSKFDFEFSGDGQSQDRGVLTLVGLKLKDVWVPPYRVQ